MAHERPTADVLAQIAAPLYAALWTDWAQGPASSNGRPFPQADRMDDALRHALDLWKAARNKLEISG